jgi:hypothetical protein
LGGGYTLYEYDENPHTVHFPWDEFWTEIKEMKRSEVINIDPPIDADDSRKEGRVGYYSRV